VKKINTNSIQLNDQMLLIGFEILNLKAQKFLFDSNKFCAEYYYKTQDYHTIIKLSKKK
jgi:hypothetical protein